LWYIESTKYLATLFVIINFFLWKKVSQRKQSSNMRKFAQSRKPCASGWNCSFVLQMSYGMPREEGWIWHRYLVEVYIPTYIEDDVMAINTFLCIFSQVS
jgi:hypothetical protein